MLSPRKLPQNETETSISRSQAKKHLNMRILHVVYSLVPGVFRGGISKAVFELAEAQALAGHQVVIFTTDMLGGERVSVSDEPLRGGLKIRWFRGSRFGRFRSPQMFEALKDESDSFDVVHSHCNFLQFNIYVRKAFAGKVPILFQPHGSLDPVILSSNWFKAIKKRVYIRFVEGKNIKAAAALVAITESEASQISLLGFGCPVVVIPNGINLVESNQSAAAAFRTRFDVRHQKLVVFVGRIHWKKGIERLLRAFAEFSRSAPEFGLVVCGDVNQYGDYGPSMVRLCDDLGIAQHTYWTGFLGEKEKVGVLSAATVFSHVSESEGMAMSILEAMSVGLPVIVSDGCYMGAAARAGVIREIPATIEALISSLRELKKKPAEWDDMGKMAKKYVEAHHSWEKIGAHAVEIYKKLPLPGGQK